MTIGVMTPNGNVGSHLVRRLVQAGERPRLLSRHPGAVPADVQPHVDTVRADAWDGDSITAATEDLDALYWVSPTPEDRDPLVAHAESAASLVAAVTANSIPRVVFQSSVGAERRHGVGEIDGLAATELALDALDVDVLHLRCGYFMTNLLMDADALRAGEYETAMDLDRRMPWVAPVDIAGVAAVRLTSRAWSGRTVQAVHGPADLSVTDVVAVLARVLGHDVTARRIDDDTVRERLAGFGMSPAQVEAVVGMTTGTRDGFVPEQARDATTTTPTSLRAWAADAFA